MKVLHLTLKKKWFEKIASGRKTHEFRELKPYWTSRLEGRTYDVILFRNGYGRNAPWMKVMYAGLSTRIVKGVKLYVIHLGAITQIVARDYKKATIYPAPGTHKRRYY